MNYRQTNLPNKNNSEKQHSPVRLQNCLISAGLEPVSSQTEKSSIASYYRQFFTCKLKIIITPDL